MNNVTANGVLVCNICDYHLSELSLERLQYKRFTSDVKNYCHKCKEQTIHDIYVYEGFIDYTERYDVNIKVILSFKHKKKT